MIVCLFLKHRVHPTPEAIQQTPKPIPEEESPPTPPTRSKRKIKITKRSGSKSSGESTPSDSPKSSKQGNSSSADSSPLINKITKQEVMPSAENSPLVNKVAKQEVTSLENGPIVNKLTQQEAVSSDATTSVSDKKDTKIKESLSASHLASKQNISPKLSGNGPVINVAGSFTDEIMKQLDTKATTSDYYSSTDLQGSEDTGPPPAAVVPVAVPTKAEDTTDANISASVAMMKSRGHARTHSAPLVLDEETVSDKITVTTVDIVTGEQSKSKGKDDKESKVDKVPPPIVVHYLGPLVLRKEVESLLIREGLSYLERKDFAVLSPTVFWNLVSVPSDIGSLIVVNWPSTGMVLH